MRDLTKDDYYWRRAMEEAYNAGYREFAMTLNPYPGAIKHAITLADMARTVGYEVINVTLVYTQIFSDIIEFFAKGEEMGLAFSDDDAIIYVAKGLDIEPAYVQQLWIDDKSPDMLLPAFMEKFPIIDLISKVDIITMSVDDMRCDSAQELNDHVKSVMKIMPILQVMAGNCEMPHFNINLLWTPEVFKWMENDDSFDLILDAVTHVEHYRSGNGRDKHELKASVQHLIYKPLSIYESVDWFWEKYQWILENRPQIKICGDGDRFIGDAALNNLLGMNMCPGENMFDIDPMGFVRKCPENPIAYDVTNIEKLKGLLYDGIPNCGETKCNCITPK